MASEYDYLVVGGGTAGCVIASRLSQAGFSVALFEAGPENYSKDIMSPVNAPHLHGTPVEYNYKSTPQAGLNNRQINNYGGRVLSGSSGVNYGLWTRGHSADYDSWATVVQDQRWSYAKLLKYFKKTENYSDVAGIINRDSHGFDGPISLIQGNRPYPLKGLVLDALKESGLEFKADGNDGNPLGIAAFTENWKNDQRQPSGLAYDLSKVKVFSNTTVRSVEIDSHAKAATGIVLLNGQTIKSSKETIITCGAVKTPQLLMLSGIGPLNQLKSLGIKPVADLPVGQNLHDHISGGLFWKLRNPEKGLAIGSPAFNDPKYFTGNPIDWISTINVPDLSLAASTDGTSVEELFGTEKRSHIEILTAYAPLASSGSAYRLPFDGTHIATVVILLLPTSRGKITLASTDPSDDPVIDPNYLNKEVDRAVMREGFRTAIRIMETTEAQKFVHGETPPEGVAPLTSKSSDSEFDARLAHVAASFYQNAGTAAMGKVVDTDCRVKGIHNLRVCDASILPLPIASHYQAGIYAVAEAASDIILGK